MTHLKLTTAVKRRFRTAGNDDRLKFEFVHEVPGMENRMLRLEQKLLALAEHSILTEYQFWMSELTRKKQILTPHALTVVAQRLRTLNEDLPGDLQVTDLDIILERETKRHLYLNAQEFLLRMRANTTEVSSWKLGEMRKQFRTFLRMSGTSLEDVGTSEKELRAMRLACDSAYSKREAAEAAARRAARSARE